MNTPILSILGKSGCGKTTLLEKLIPALKQRGYRIAAVKHHAHPGFEIDQPGKDTWRFAQAGADQVIIAAPDRVASIRSLERELSLDEIAASILDVDLILTEGFKRAGKPAIEVVRAANGLELISGSTQRIAIATDTVLPIDLPQFNLEDIHQIVDFIIQTFLRAAP